jgi:c-di-GMP-specific phosphodiesterase
MRVTQPAGDADLSAALQAAETAILASSGDLRDVAQAMVSQVTLLSHAAGASMFEMRGGDWARIAASGATVVRPITIPILLEDIPTAPMLFLDTAEEAHPVAAAARGFGIPSFAVVPLHLWPDVPAMITMSGEMVGSLGYDDLATLSAVAVIGAAAAHRTPVDDTRGVRPVESLAWHQQMLEGVVRGVSMDETLRRVCLEIEARYPGARCTVLLADPVQGVLRHAAGPSLSHTFRSAIDGLAIADGSGACGTAAATRLAVVIEDIATDPKTAPFLEIAVEHQLRSVWSLPMLDADGDVLGTFALYRDEPHSPDADEVSGVTAVATIAGLAIERFHTERALAEAAHRDPLTSLGNRVMFHDLLEYALAAAMRVGSRCAVLFLDLDGFKFVNDSLGHAAGDRILVEVAGRLLQLLPDGCLVARFGGDEFTVLVEDATMARVNEIADAIDTALNEPFEIDGGEFFLTTAIGIAISDGENADPGSVVRDADAAMYVAKGRGRGRRAVFDQAMRDRAVARVSIEGDLRRALRERSLTVVYQPLIRLGRHEWCGVEALARWTHPTLGAIPPADFIPLAEELGVIGQLGAQVLATSMAQAREWDEAGISVPIAVNISALQLTDPDVVPEILAALEVSGVRPDLVYLEVTETAVMQNPSLSKVLLTELGHAGIRAVIDDFGTGHSSIARLSELPVSGVKIDRRFLETLGAQPGSTKIVAAIIELAHAFGITVTAEGVETAVALRVLEDLGCDQAQGYLFGRPSSPLEVAAVLRQPPATHET